MRIWSVTQIVHQTSHRHISYVIFFNSVVGCILSIALTELATNVIQEMHLLLRKMTNSQAVCKSGMRCTWKHVVKCAQLVHILKPCKDRIIDIFPEIQFELYALGVDRVLAYATVYFVVVC